MRQQDFDGGRYEVCMYSVRSSPDGVLGIEAWISPVDYIRRILLTPLLACIKSRKTHTEKGKRDAQLRMAFGVDFLFQNAPLAFLSTSLLRLLLSDFLLSSIPNGEL